jgi:hypothetical protein
MALYIEACFLPARVQVQGPGPGAAAARVRPKSAKSVVLRGRSKLNRQKSVHIGVSIGKNRAQRVKIAENANQYNMPITV